MAVSKLLTRSVQFTSAENQQDWESAKRLYEPVVQHLGREASTVVLFQLGCCYGNVKDYAKATDLFRRCLDEEPKHREAKQRLSWCLKRMGQSDAAFSILKETSAISDRQYWLWVTRPQYYQDDDGADRRGLDPVENSDATVWWTCHKNTRRGDLIFLWRTQPKSDIGYLMQAESDAYPVSTDEYWIDKGWRYACDARVYYKFSIPVTIRDLREDPYFEDWNAFRAQFRRQVFNVPLPIWRKLADLLIKKNPDFAELLQALDSEPLSPTITREEELEDALEQDLGMLRKYGFNLELYSKPDGTTGRQLVCTGDGGRIDLLCYDRSKNQYVVIELKNVRADRNTFGQAYAYLGWVTKHVAAGKPVVGLVISRGYDAKFESAMSMTPAVSHINLSDLGFE